MIFSDELGDPDRVSCVERLDREAAAGKITEEADLGLPAKARPDQIGDLGDDKSGNDERARMELEQFQAG